MNEEIIQSLNDKLDVAIERGKELINDEQIQERIKEVKEVTEETVRKHPIKSILVGLAVGFLIGKALSGDDD